MAHTGRLRRLVVLSLLGVTLVGAGSCVGLNIWLNSDRFSERVNAGSKQVFVEWDRARMIFPGRVVVEGLRIRGNNRKVQWSVELRNARASIDLRALRSRQFRTSRLRGEGLRYLMRRKPVERGDLSLPAGSPEIPGLAVEPMGPPLAVARTDPGWRFDLEGLDLEQVEELWVDGYRLPGEGTLSGDLHFQIRGPFSFDDLRLTMNDGRLLIAGEEAGRALDLELAVDLAPFLPYGVDVADLLGGWKGRAKLQGEVDDLGFLSRYLGPAGKLKLTGTGRLDCDLVVDHGGLEAGSTLRVDAEKLAADFSDFHFEGSGRVEGKVTAVAGESEPLAELRIGLHDLEGEDPGAAAPEFVEPDLEIRVVGRTPDYLTGLVDPDVTVRMRSLELPDLRMFNSLFPDGTGVRLLSGSARIDARLDLSDLAEERGTIHVGTDDVVLEVNGRPLAVDLELDAPHRVGVEQRELSIDGTRIRLGQPSGWNADLRVDAGRVVLGSAPAGGRGIRSLRPADGELSISGRISDVGLLNDYLSYGKWLRLEGAVDLETDLLLQQGRLVPGSEVGVVSERLQAVLFGWTIEGKAALLGRQLSGKAAGHSELLVDFEEVSMGREGRPRLRAPSLHLKARGADLGGGEGLSGLELRIDLAGSDPIDLVTFNRYLPHPDLVTITGGSGSVAGHVALAAEGGEIEFRVASRGLTARTAGESLNAEMGLELQMSSARPGAGRFDLDRLALRLDGMRVGDARGSAGSPWHGMLEVTDGKVILGRPPQIDGTFTLALTDTRPLTRVIEARNQALGWFDRWLTLDEVRGTGELHVGPEGIRFDDLDLRSDEAILTAGINLLAPGADGKRRVEDLRFRGELLRPLEIDPVSLNEFLPPAGLITFLSGRTELEGVLELSSDLFTGEFDLTGSQLGALIRGEEIRTDLTLDVEMQSRDVTSQRFDVAGTRVRFEDTRWIDDDSAERNRGWWGELRVTQGQVTMGRPLELDAIVELKLRDTRPLVHMLGETKRIVQWFERVLEIPDVRGSARVRLGSDGMRFDSIKITGDGLLIEGLMRFGEAGEYALLYLRLHGVGVAVELRDGKHRFGIIEPRKWFRKRLESLPSDARSTHPDYDARP